MATIPASENEFPQILMSEVAAPSTPATGLIVAYAKSDGLLYWKDDTGTERQVGVGDLTGHTGDTSDAHDASAISVLDTAANFTGTDVEAVLAELQDNIDGVGAGGVPSGTSNPGSPSTGDMFFRTDLGYLIFYDGTRWVTVQEYTMSNQIVVGTAGISADAYGLMPLNKTYQTFVTSWDIMSYVSSATTWVVTLQTVDTELDGFTTLDSVSTAGQNAAEMYSATRAVNTVVNGTVAHAANTVRGLRVFYDEQAGSATFFGAVNVRYRLIIP